jgi:uncharacterized membrane protein/GT2 family glycosyltransferase
MKRLPFMSVVVSSFNSEKTLGAVLGALKAQKYPKKKLEIIVVDDGSTDKSAFIAEQLGVKTVRLGRNRGLSAARNAGLKVAQGEIYVGMDDDAVPEPNFLKELAKGYQKGRPTGVGGSLIGGDSVSDKYVEARGRLNRSKPPHSIIGRLKAYFANNLKPRRLRPVNRVGELYGSASSFPVEVLHAVGGWDESLSGIEDRDLSLRIKKAFPRRPFYLMRDAQINSLSKQDLGGYLRRPWKRGVQNWQFHRQNRIAPPFFPLPVLAAGGLAWSAFAGWPGLVATIIALPQILYFWWPYRMIRQRRLAFGLFSYIQMAEESATWAGLIRGWAKEFAWSKHLHGGLGLVATLGWYYSLQNDSLKFAVFSTGFMLLAPGYFLLRILARRRSLESRWTGLVYSVGLSLVSLMLIGLGVNAAGPALGNHQPLSLMPLGLTITVWMVLLIGFDWLWRKPAPTYPKLKKPASIWLMGLWGAILPLLAAGGAITLNNGGGGWLAVAALTLGALYFATLALWRRFEPVYPWALFAIGLSILLATSLRGWNITGHDVMQEFQVFQLTSWNSTWNMSFYQDAYNACISITILPTIIQKLGHIYAPYVFKLVFPFIFALIGPALYLSWRRFASNFEALMATFVFISFPAFVIDLAMLNRQEAAFFCLALALMAGLDLKLSRWQRGGLTFLFLIGMVLSHYSTSYVTGAILLGAAGLGLFGWIYNSIKSAFKKPAGTVENFGLKVIPLPVTLLALVGIFYWNTVATHSSGNIGHTLQALVTDLPQMVTEAASAEKSPAAPKPTANSRVSSFAHDEAANRTAEAGRYYTPQQAAASPVKPVDLKIQPLTSLGHSLHLKAKSVFGIFELAKSVYARLLQLLIILGTVLIFFWHRNFSKLPRQYVYLGMAAVAVIGAQVILPPDVIDYGLQRMIEQGLIFFALPTTIALLVLLKALKLGERWTRIAATVLMTGFFLVMSGVLPALTGGYKPALATSNSGFYYESYLTHQSEISADKWLATETPKGSRVYSDEFSRRKLITYGNIFAQPTLVPGAIPIDSYVYLSVGNTQFDDVPHYYDGDLIFYSVPNGFLNQNKDLVYSSGGVKIYK